MFDLRIVYRIVRYIIQTIILFMILKYTPIIDMDESTAITVAIVLSILSISFEYLCNYCYYQKNSLNRELFQDISHDVSQEIAQDICDTCDIKKTVIDPPTTNIGENCRIVCDAGQLPADDKKSNNQPNKQRYWSDKYDNICQDEKCGFGDMFDDNYPYTGNYDNNNKTNSEMQYSDLNHLPVSQDYKSTDYEYGYSYIPPERWYGHVARPPVCVTSKKCEVMPIYTNGTPIDVKEFDSSRKIMPPANINVKYINEKLNV